MSMRFTEIGQQLRAYRLESGLRAEEIAARLGVSRAALYRYEKGEVIKLDTIKRLAELLKISPLSLLGIGVEYYNRPIGYFERIRQIEETADQILQLAGPLCYLTTSDAYDAALAEAFEEAADQAGSERDGDAQHGRAGDGHPGRAQADVCDAAAEHHRDDLAAGGAAPDRRRHRQRHRTCPTGCAGFAAMSRCRRSRTSPTLMEAEPMGLQFGLLAGSPPSSSFKILRARDRVSLAINPFRTDTHPGAQTGVAMITGADEAIAAHQRVAEASWREAIKGPAGAARLRQMMNVASPVA